MMNPEMMKMAQEQMARMGPEQMAQMQANMKNISPEMMRATMSQMQQMSPDDINRAKDRMRGMSSDDMVNQSKNLDPSRFQQMQSAQDKYGFDASQGLKVEGNQFVQQGNYKEAAKKYARALKNLETNKYTGSENLKLSCNRNLVLCYLRTDKNEEAVELCTQILKTHPEDIKVWYRRGQAYSQMDKPERASVDLERALELSPDDETIQSAYKSALDKSADSTKIEEAEEALKEEKRQAEEERKKKEENDRKVEKMAQVASQISKQPEMVKEMGNKLANMSESELKQLNTMSKAQGMPEISPEMAKMAASSIASMEPDQLQNMIKLSQAMNPNMKQSLPSSSLPPSSSSALSSVSDDDEGEPASLSSSLSSSSQPGFSPQIDANQMASVSKMMENPAMMDMMEKMWQNMSPEDLQRQMKMTGKDLSLDEAEKMCNGMKNFKPEHMRKLLKGATWCHKVYSTLKGLYKNQYVRGALGGIVLTVVINKFY